MLELGIGADLFRDIGAALLIAFGLALLAAILLPKTAKRKAGWSAVVLAVFIGPMVPGVYRSIDYKLRYAKAKALFDERCKTAGERVYSKAAGVNRFHLASLKPERKNFSSQYELDDPYGADYAGESYAFSMLWGALFNR